MVDKQTAKAINQQMTQENVARLMKKGKPALTDQITREIDLKPRAVERG